MVLVRFGVTSTSGRRQEVHETNKRDVEVGRDPACDLVLDHDSVALNHARVLVRRQRLILVDLGRTKRGRRAGESHMHAPIVLRPGESFDIGEVEVTASLVDDSNRGLVGRMSRDFRVVHEIQNEDSGVRRYQVRLRDGGLGELVIATDWTPRAVAARWQELLVRTRGQYGHHLSPVVDHGEIDGAHYIIEAIPPGIRLEDLICEVRFRRIHLPLETSVLVLAQVSEAAVRTCTPVDAHRIHLGVDGSVFVLSAPPRSPRSIQDMEPTPSGTESAEGVVQGKETIRSIIALAGELLRGGCDCPERIREVLCAAVECPTADTLADFPESLRRAAYASGLDPSLAHVARAVRLVHPAVSRRISSFREPYFRVP